MNKKKILSIIVIAAFAAVMAFNVNLGSSKNSLTNIVLANVEALAGCDSPVYNMNGREVDMHCDTGRGYYDLKACDFNTQYSSTCEGRCANC